MFKKAKDFFFAVNKYGIRSCFFNYFSILISSVIVVSFQKSGRTWLRLMFAKVLSSKYNIKKINIETQIMTLFKPVPNVFFTHAGCTVNNNRLDFKKMFRKKRIIFLVRDPRDEIVSLFHDHTKRNLWYKGDNVSEFIRDPQWGLKKVIAFMNDWIEELNKSKENFLLIKYEDMQKDIRKELKRFLDFLNIKVDDNIIEDAVNYGSFGNMRKMELSATIKDWRMRPGNINDPNSYRTRKGKVGSHKEELKQEDIDYINKELKEKLNPIFRY